MEQRAELHNPLIGTPPWIPLWPLEVRVALVGGSTCANGPLRAMWMRACANPPAVADRSQSP